MVDAWTCCGHDLRELCTRAGTPLPARCFFCGKPRPNLITTPQPEDALAFELAEIWCAKIREHHGDPETHVSSFDQYGRADVEAWRAVAKRALENSITTQIDHLLQMDPTLQIQIGPTMIKGPGIHLAARRASSTEKFLVVTNTLVGLKHIIATIR